MKTQIGIYEIEEIESKLTIISKNESIKDVKLDRTLTIDKVNLQFRSALEQEMPQSLVHIWIDNKYKFVERVFYLDTPEQALDFVTYVRLWHKTLKQKEKKC